MNYVMICMLFLYATIVQASWVDTLVQTMPLEHKVAQLIMPGVRLNIPESIADTIDLIKKYPFCGLLLVNSHHGFHGHAHRTEHMTIMECAQLVKQMQQLSSSPLLMTLDAEWGLAMRLRDGINFPRAMTLAAMHNEQLIFAIGQEIGRQLRMLGVHINFAPVVDVNNNPANPVIHDRSFGEDKEAVVRKSLLYMRGLEKEGIITCAKHFPGHGDTDVDSHYDLPCLTHSCEHLHAVELYPFKRFIEAGVPMIMTAHMHIPAFDGRKNISATLSPAIITELLKKELGFAGIVVTDCLRMHAVTKYYTSAQIAVQAFIAGNDIILDPEDPEAAIQGICQAVKEGIIREEDITQRVAKILMLKHGLGLYNQPQTKAYAHNDINTSYAYALKYFAFQEAVTVVQDGNNLIPLEKKEYACIVIGAPQENTFSRALQKQYTIHHYDKDVAAHAIQEDTVIIALFGLTKNIHNHYGICPTVFTLLQNVQYAGKQSIVVIFGTPYCLSIMPRIPALVAYEADANAQHAAVNVLSGVYSAHGKLPVLRSIE